MQPVTLHFLWRMPASVLLPVICFSSFPPHVAGFTFHASLWVVITSLPLHRNSLPHVSPLFHSKSDNLVLCWRLVTWYQDGSSDTRYQAGCQEQPPQNQRQDHVPSILQIGQCYFALSGRVYGSVAGHIQKVPGSTSWSFKDPRQQVMVPEFLDSSCQLYWSTVPCQYLIQLKLLHRTALIFLSSKNQFISFVLFF